MRTKYAGQVTLGYVAPATVTVDFLGCVSQLLLADRGKTVGKVISSSHNSMVAHGRNLLVQAFLDEPKGPGSEWLLMLDTDMTFTSDLAERLLRTASEQEAKIVSGVAVTRQGGGKLGVNAYSLKLSDDKVPVGKQEVTPFPSTPVEVDAVGAACLMVHRSVLEKIGAQFKSWFAFKEFTTRLDGKDYLFEAGEDIVFCLRAMAVGEPIVLDPNVRLGHVKDTVLTFADLDNYRDIVASVGEEAYLTYLKDRRRGL